MSVFIGPEFLEYYNRWPLVLVDIGASMGLIKPWDSLVEHLRVIGFEPDERAFLHLIDRTDATDRQTDRQTDNLYPCI